MAKEEVIIIGIAGGTGSGKSTLAKKIKEIFKEEIQILCHDYYYKCNGHLSPEKRAMLNYDHPNSFDTELLIKDLKKLKEGSSINRPVYSFVEHTRMEETVLVHPSKVIILEGILIFENKELINMMDMKVFVDTDADIRLIRRLIRDVKERGRDLDSVTKQYMTTVKPMHEEFVEQSKKNADIIIPEGGYNLVALDMLIHRIKYILEMD